MRPARGPDGFGIRDRLKGASSHVVQSLPPHSRDPRPERSDLPHPGPRPGSGLRPGRPPGRGTPLSGAAGLLRAGFAKLAAVFSPAPNPADDAGVRIDPKAPASATRAIRTPRPTATTSGLPRVPRERRSRGSPDHPGPLLPASLPPTGRRGSG